MSAHKPATPLPWHADLRGAPKSQPRIACTAKNLHGAECSSALGIVPAIADADYIAHAANAYPRLVEALRALEQACYVYGQESQVPHLPVLQQAGALLRELGEVAS
jgi:hypothetical protein